MRRVGKVMFTAGCLLILCSVVLLVFLQVQTKQAENRNAEITETMELILAERTEAAVDAGWTGDMPALELQGDDFIALLEIPAYGLKLPVCGVWDSSEVLSYPCRFYGSAYNGTLVIGGYDQPGQFDFFDRIQDGEMITLTDMTGRQFQYAVERIERYNEVPMEVLADKETDLTLFVRDVQYLEYIVLRCDAK